MGDMIDAMLSGEDGEDGEGGNAPTPPKRDLGSLLGKAVAGASNRAAARSAAQEELDLTSLASLSASDWKVVVRYLPADYVAAVLGGAPMVVAVRLVDAFDAEGQAWIGAQSSVIEAVTPSEHAAAARVLLKLVEKLRSEGRFGAAAAEPVATASSPSPSPSPSAQQVDERVAPNASGLGVSVAVRQDASTSVPPAASMAPPATSSAPSASDPLRETIAALVAGARKQSPETLLALADAVDHPVIAAGLRLIANGADAHALNEGLRSIEYDYMHEQERQLAVIRAGLLSIRFGEKPEEFRQRLK